MQQYQLLYVTASSEDEALSIGRVLVEKRLAACVNVLPKMRSIYWWKGAIEEAHEAVLLVKTTESKAAEATRRIKELHGYECPCVAALSISPGNQEYFDWIEAETTDEK